MPRIEINYQTCLRTGQCYYLHPEILRRREDDHPEPVKDRYEESERAAMEEAADLCPTESIAIVED